MNVLQRLSLTFWRLKLGWPERLVTVSHHSLQNLMVRYPMAKSWARSIVNGVCINKLEPFHYLPKSKDRECVRIVYVGSLEIERKGVDLFTKPWIFTYPSPYIFESFNADRKSTACLERLVI